MKQVDFKLGVKEGVMAEQSDESGEEEFMGEEIGESSEIEEWYQNEVDEEIKGVGSRVMVKPTERSDQ